MAEFQESLSAPWRMKYLQALTGGAAADGCFLCEYARTPDKDAQNGVLWRTKSTLVVLNRFPYTNGHVLIAPIQHAGELHDFPEATLTELMLRIRDAQRVLRSSLDAGGFNIGLNAGRCAGAGLPDHLHWHVVPRWGGDTNFMGIVAGVRVIPQTAEEVRRDFLAAAAKLKLP